MQNFYKWFTFIFLTDVIINQTDVRRLTFNQLQCQQVYYQAVSKQSGNLYEYLASEQIGGLPHLVYSRASQ